MKRFLALFISIFLVCGLCSCKSDKKGNAAAKTTVTTAHMPTRAYEDVRLHSAANEIADGLFTGSLSDFSDEEKEMIRSYLLERNFKIKYNEDGTALLSRSEEEWLVSTKWIENKYTEGVPEQTIGTITMSMENLKNEDAPEYIFMIKSSDDKNAYSEYKKALEKAGFKSIGGAAYEGDDVFEGIKDGEKHIRISLTGKGYILKIADLSAVQTNEK